MARTIAQIQQSIITAKNADATLAGLSSTSNVAIWLLWTYVVAVCHWALENLFDSHRAEVGSLLATQRPHTLQWYVTRAKQFQYGVALPAESDTYPNPDTDPSVAIVQYAAAVELTNLVRIKAATLTGGNLAPLTVPQLTALTAYMQLIKDAGVRMQVTSGNPDMLRLDLLIFYDPLVLGSTGARLDGGSATPVKDAVAAFLTTLPFNGLFVINNLVAALQRVEGVVIGQVQIAQATYAALPYTVFPVEYSPDAGYMALDDAYLLAHVLYVSHGPV